MKIAEKGALASIREMLPHFVVAGTLACRVQDDITKNGKHNGDAKSGDRFTEILTDADIIVETYLGTIILTTLEDAAFYGEEYERDRVSNYFPREAPYLVTLDPVDGTLYFADGLPIFAIILTVCAGDRIIGAVTYLPREGRFYFATEDDGAFTTTAGEVENGVPPIPYAVPEKDPVVIVGNSDLPLERALTDAGFIVVNPNRDYDKSLGWRRTNVCMFTGEVAGMIVSNAQLIDAAAMSFIIGKAGGKVSGTAYDPSSKRVPRLVVGTSPSTYDALAKIAGL